MTTHEDVHIQIDQPSYQPDTYVYRPLKSQHKKIQYPDMKLHLGSMEIKFMLSAHETIISQFRLNKRHVEKELSNLFNQAKKMKKIGKDKPETTIDGIDSMVQQLQSIKEDYLKMTKIEDDLINILDQRLNHLKVVSKNVKDPSVLQEYFETKLNRAIVDYMLQNQHFESASKFVKDTSIEPFSNIHIYIQTNSILQNLKSLSNKTVEEDKI